MPTVFITGSNRGLGLEFVRQYAAAGWDVLAATRNPNRANALCRLADGSGQSIEVVALDIADADQVSHLPKVLHGRSIDLLLNNAGVEGDARQHLPDIDFKAWIQTLDINTLGPLRVSLALLSNVDAGSGRKIVGLTSGMGSITNNHTGRYYAYRSSKAGLNAAFRSLAVDLRGQGIVVAVINPGRVRTDMGGPNAILSASESVATMRHVINGLTMRQSGGFYDYNGSPLPW